MSTASDRAPGVADATMVATAVEVVIPVYNEERQLAASVHRVAEFLRAELPYSHRILIVDNASTDGTWAVARRLEAELPTVEARRLEQKGRGRALRAAWSASSADVVCYMDVDLSTDLRAFLPLVAPLLSGHSDVAIGSRLHRDSRVRRGPKREVISRGYNLLLRVLLGATFSDAQCGFKAVRADVARALLPQIRDDEWFFDTELLVLAQRAGFRIHEVPVDWVDDPDSRVKIVTTALADLRGIARLRDGLGLASFLGIGLASMLAYLVLYLLLRQVAPAQPANLLALVITAVANTAANRRLTFGVRGRDGLARHHLAGLGAFLCGLALTSGALWCLHQLGRPTRLQEATALVLANLAATVLRYGVLRRAIGGVRAW
jgi:glycosyltransferase involved in cell wall biosynthesis